MCAATLIRSLFGAEFNPALSQNILDLRNDPWQADEALMNRRNIGMDCSSKNMAEGSK
jgi:hypothetical protein